MCVWEGGVGPIMYDKLIIWSKRYECDKIVAWEEEYGIIHLKKFLKQINFKTNLKKHGLHLLGQGCSLGIIW